VDRRGDHDLTVELDRATSVEELNAAVRERADTGPQAV
jgi:hypothetical protein